MLVSKDEGVRAGTTAAKLGGLKAVFKKGGTTTAGNASQVCRCVGATYSALKNDLWGMGGGSGRFVCVALWVCVMCGGA